MDRAREYHGPEGFDVPYRATFPSDRLLESDTGLELYAVILGEWWRVIALTTFLAMAATGVVSKFVLTKWYRATATVRPISQAAVETRMEGGLVSLGGSLGALMGISAEGDAEAREYMTILKSFTFNTALVARHRLAPDLVKDWSAGYWSADAKNPDLNSRRVRWGIYRVLKERLDFDYSLENGNLSIRYMDRDPVTAERILGFYLNDLRDQLRQQAIRDAKAAVVSLQEEVKNTSDPLLVQSLYRVIAKQVQREKLAQVQADFAFKVLEPPVAPYKPYWPKTLLNCLLVGFLVSSLFGGATLLFWRPKAAAPAGAVEAPQARRRHFGDRENPA